MKLVMKSRGAMIAMDRLTGLRPFVLRNWNTIIKQTSSVSAVNNMMPGGQAGAMLAT